MSDKDTITLTSQQLWGMQLLTALGEFIEKVATGDRPLTTTIVAKFNDVEFPVIHIWATADEKEPAARCAELAEARRALEVTVEALRAELKNRDEEDAKGPVL